ncbi:MAG: sensor histidine kinase [Rickettsia endosymbiont of Haemaphysalis japonica]
MAINNENQQKDLNKLENFIKHNWQTQLSPIFVTLIPSSESVSNQKATQVDLVTHYADIIKSKLELEEVTNKLKQVECVKRDLIQSIIYGLKIPRNKIFALVALLHEIEDDLQKQDCLASIVDFIQELLDYYDKLSNNLCSNNGLIPIVLKRFDPQQLVNKIIDKALPIAQHKGLNLSCNFQYDITNSVISDSYRIQAILEQLIDNSIKFTNQGNVVVTVNMFAISPALSESEQNKREMVLQFIVHDTGIGLSREIQEYLRKEFDGFDIQYEELVSGLSFVKRLIDELHGEIEVTSTKGKSSTITCNIPVKLPLLDDVLYDDN